MPNPPVHIMEAVQAAVTRVTSRVDIYEADGVTPWLLDAPLIDGNVSVDQARGERRTVELTLANQDGALDPYEQGFWYDKVIKPFRGIKYRGVKRQPRILVAYQATSTTTSVLPGLRALGYSNVTLNTQVTSVEECYGYDIVVFDGYTGAISTAASQLAQACYAAGISVLTTGDENSNVQIPLIVTHHQLASGSTRSVSPYGAHPVAQGWDTATDGTSSTAVHATSVRSTAVPVGVFVYNAVAGYPMIVEENPNGNGARWGHFSFYAFNTAERRAPLKAMVSWIFTRGNDMDWETQVGEFLIDQISTQFHPDNVSVSGRDYTKRLMTSKFVYNTTFASGQSLEGLIRTISLNGGINKFIFPTTGKTIARDFTFDRGVTRWDAVSEIAAAYGYELFFDGQGYMRMQEYRDPSTSPTVFTFEGGSAAYVQSAYPETVLDEYPLAFWRFREAPGASVAADASGHGIDAAITNTVLVTEGGLADRTSTPGSLKNENSAVVNALSVTNDPRLALTEVTIEALIRLGADNAATCYIVLKGGTGLDNTNYAFLVQGSSNRVYFYASVAGVWTAVASAPTGNALVPGKWHHVVASYKYPGTCRVYVDGVRVTNVTTTAPLDNRHRTTSIRMTATTSATGTGNKYAYYGTGKGGYTIQTGDYLEYDIWYPTTGQAQGIDLETSGGVFRSVAPNDQNGQGLLTQGTYASDAWHTRRFSLSGRVGSTITDVDLVNESDTTGTQTAYYRNINIKRSDGTIALRVWNEGDPLPTMTLLYNLNATSTFIVTDSRPLTMQLRPQMLLDELVIYDRQLSDAEVATNYKAISATSRKTASLGDGNIESYTKTTRDSRIYNHVVVVGGSSDTTSVSADVKNENPSSPTNVSRLGDRVYEFVSSFITTQAQALDVANSLLSVHALEEYELAMSTIVLPWLEVGEIVAFRDPKPNRGDPARFLLSSFTIPLKLGKMNPLGKRIMNSG